MTAHLGPGCQFVHEELDAGGVHVGRACGERMAEGKGRAINVEGLCDGGCSRKVSRTICR